MIASPNQPVITTAWYEHFQTNVEFLVQDSWARRARTLVWDKIMMSRESKTARDLLFWLLETAKIVDEGFGGNKRADDLGAMFFEIVNKNSGTMLRLTTNEIRDNQMSSSGLNSMPALDFAGSWARQVGGHAAYKPQELLIQLLMSGTTALGYDGVPFFSTAHPINPFASSVGTFSNRISGFPLSVASGGVYNVAQMVYNFAQIMGSVRKTLQPNGFPRDVQWKYIVGGSDMMLALPLIFETKTFGGGTVSVGPNENIVSRWGIEPLILPELTEPGVCYLVGEALSSEGAAFIFNERDPYVLSSYVPDNEAELQRRKEFEWSFDGRNAASYGHPYLAMRIEAA